MNNFQRALKHKNSSSIDDEKIALLDREMRKTKLGESIANSTSGLYTVTGFEPGDPAIPEIPAIPAVPPTYENVTGGLSDANDFAWPDQGDGSDPDAAAVIPSNLYTTYNGEQVAATRYIDTYNGETLDYGDHPPIGALVIRGGWLNYNYIGYLSGSGIRGVGTTVSPNGDIGQAIYDAYNSWPFPGRIVKTIYQWEQLDCLFGSCKGASQYYPSDLSATSTPKADYALYAWTLWIPADADGNPLPNRIMTDPGSPEIPAVPGVPEGPPKPIVISRNALGDPNYYSGNPLDFLMGLLDLGKQGLDYILGAADNFLSGDFIVDTLNDAISGTAEYAIDSLNKLKTSVPAVDISVDIALSVLQNKPIVYEQDDINPEHIQKLVDNLDPKQIGTDIPINNEQVPYADDNIITDSKGNVRPRNQYPTKSDGSLYTADEIIEDPELKKQFDSWEDDFENHPNNTKPMTLNPSLDGYDNPLAHAGQAQGQIVIPDDGSEPYFHYEDHAYHNLESEHSGEVSDPIKAELSDAIHQLAGYSTSVEPGTQGQNIKTDSTTPNTGKMSDYPPSIRGDVIKTFSVPLSQLPPEVQSKVRSQLGESFILSEEWQSPKHTGIQKDMKKRFFDPKDIAPEYPKKNPEPMNGGYNSKSTLAPKKLSRDPVIKLTKKDLSRNHRLTKKEVQDMMDTINKINKFLDANPAELIHARIRYPKDDPRLAELNWKLDQQLSASDEYLEKRFPENKQQTARVKKILARNIELTDPRTFKSVKQPVTYEKMFKGEDPNKRVRLKDYSKKSPARFFKKENKTDTSRIKWLGGHVDINRVKELNEEKKERERIAELKKQQEIFHAEMSRLRKEKNKHYDWRTGKDLTEGMTTDALIPVTLDATGDVDLVGLGHETPNPLVQPGAENNNGTYTFGPVDLEYGYASTLSFTRTIDLSQVDTVVFDFTAGDITDFEFAVNASFYYLSTSSGSKVITLKQSDKVKNAYMSWIVYKNRGEPVGTNRISGVALQRRAPMNVFVGLDDPEASAFIRDTLDSQSLSPDEKKKKLEEQLGAGADYLVQMYGEGIFTGATEISDVELQQSFADIAQGLPYTDEDDAFDNPYYTDPVPDLDDDSDFDPDTFEYAGDSGTEIAGANYPYGTPGMEAPYTHTRPMMIDVDGKKKKINADDPSQWPSILKKAQGTSAMVAHYKPQGKVIKEKKTLKDITEKIPGYYDGLLYIDNKIKKFKDFAEGMTTAALVPVTLDGSDEVLSDELSTYDSSDAKVSSIGDNGVQLGVPEGQSFTRNIDTANHTQVRAAVFKFDSSRLDTLVINISGYGGGEDSWCDPACVYDNRVRYLIVPENNPSGTNISGLLYNGNNTISLPSSLSISDLEVHVYQYANDGEYSGGYNPPSYVNSINVKRRAPMSVFVGLDDPEASAFIRDTLGDQNLSPEEKKKKLEDMLGAGADYLIQMYGEGIFTGATEISDTELQQSFADIAQRDPYTDDDGANPFDPTYDKDTDELLDDSDFDPDTFEYAGDSGTEIAGYSLRPDGTSGFNNPGDEVYDPATKTKYKLVPRKGYGYNQWVPIKKAEGSGTMVAHYEPQGETIMEKNKKSFSDLTKKIPGYYDGKPAPLGFPLADPPKMKDGMHPDLVDGKKTAKRFNRLDPISAKAMPKTGNPLIDKKVKAAAKKPK